MSDFFQEAIYCQDLSRRIKSQREGNNQKNQSEFELPPIEIDDIINQEELKNFLEDLNCPICFNIIEDPKTCINCEATFCNSCISQWQSHQGGKKCPCCRDQGQQKFFFQRGNHAFFNLDGESQKYTECPKIFKKILNTIQINCYNKGCNTIIKYDERISHLKVCEYQLRKCENNQCLEKVTLLTKSYHNQVCEYRKEPCKYCKKLICLIEMSLHEEFCEDNKQKCTDCKAEFQIQRFKEHENICPDKKIQCKRCKGHFFRKVFQYHSKAKCYESLYRNQQKDLNKKERMIEKNKDQMDKIMELIQQLKSELQSETEVDKKKLIDKIDELQKNNQKVEDEIDEQDESDNYPDDFESIEELDFLANQDEYEFEFIKQSNKNERKKNYFSQIKQYEDCQFQKLSFPDSFESFSSNKNQLLGEQSQKFDKNNNNIKPQIYFNMINQNQIKNQIFQGLESEYSQGDSEQLQNHKINPSRIMDSFELTHSNYLYQNKNYEANNQNENRDYQIQQLNHQQINQNDSFFKEIFNNSEDRKEFFNCVEENLLL